MSMTPYFFLQYIMLGLFEINISVYCIKFLNNTLVKEQKK